ncbi:MAG: response regulator, partial [Bacteroidia bacterium]|nr:response regulator [Bacteroidia bacterium]
FNGKEFLHINERDGLSNNQIWKIAKDRNGNIWIATYKGLNIYDGKKFIQVDSDFLINNSILSFAQDEMGYMWVSVYGKGVAHLKFNSVQDLSKDSLFTITRYVTEDCPNEDKNCYEGLTDNIIRSILTDKEGNVWFATNENGLIKFDGKEFTSYNNENGLNDLRTYSLIQDKIGNIWFATIGGGAYRFNGKVFEQFSVNEGLSNTRVISLFEDSGGDIWAGTFGGGVNRIKFQNNEKEPVEIKSFNEAEGLSNGIVWSILEDREGNMWFGTEGGGISKFNEEVFSHYTEKDGLSKNEVISIIEDDNQELWFGTLGGGINRYDGKIFKRYDETDGLNNNQIWSLLQDKSGTMWFGTYSGISLLERNSDNIYDFQSGLESNHIMSMYEDREGNIWIGKTRGLSKYNGDVMTHYNEGKMNESEIKCIHQDKSGDIWFGTSGIGAIKYDGYAFEYIDKKRGLSDDRVYSVAEDALGNVWFGTYGGGISILRNNFGRDVIDSQAKIENRKQKKFDWIYINSESGLSDDAVTSMVFDDKGNLWVGTIKGISKIEVYYDFGFNEVQIGKIKKYGKLEGFSGIECNQNAICKDAKGNIWFGTVNGAVKYDSQKDDINLLEPKTHITNIKLFFENVDWSQYADSVSTWYKLPIGLELPYTQYHLTFEFIGVSLRVPEKVKYLFKLEGFDEEWSPPVKENFVTYSKLPAGKFTFKVRACNDEGIWNKQATSYSFEITPPFWQTWWFYLIAVSIIGLVINTVYNVRIKAKIRKIKFESILLQRTRENEMAQKAVEVKSDFLAKMSHEIRTPMNAVIGMINMLMDSKLTDRQLYYTQTIKKSSELLLTLLNDILDLSKLEVGKMQLNKESVNLLLTLENLILFFDAQAKRNGNALKFKIDENVPMTIIADEVRLMQVFNNLISNAIKFTQNGTIDIKLSTLENSKTLKVEVIDTGVGISEKDQDKLFKEFSQIETEQTTKVPGTGLGLSISAKIIELMGGEIGIESEEDKGSNFWFTFEPEIASGQAKVDSSLVLFVNLNDNKVDDISAVFDRWNWNAVKADSIETSLSLMKSDKKINTIVFYDEALKSDIKSAIDKLDDQLIIILSKSKNRGKAKEIDNAIFIAIDPLNPVTLLKALLGEEPVEVKSEDAQLLGENINLGDVQILVVEDNVINQELIALMLEKLGCSVQFANNGKEAISKVKNHDYDLIIMDIHMPVMDGITATQEIKKLDKDIPPIVALTAHAMAGDLERFIEQGMNDYLPKPIDSKELRRVIEKWVINKDSADSHELVSSDNGHDLKISSIELLNREIVDNINKLGKGDGSAFEKVILSYFNDFIELEKSINDGFKKKDLEQVQFGIHTLKGSSAFIGARSIAEIAKSIEIKVKESNELAAKDGFKVLQQEVKKLKGHVKKEYSIDC